MSKYKVGDKVRVRKDLCVYVGYGSCTFVYGMRNYCGKEVIISCIDDCGRYRIKEDNMHWYWTDEMFEGLAKELKSSNEEVGSIEKDTSHYYVKNVDNTMKLIYNIIEVASETKTQAVLMFNVLKYLIRWNRKDGIIDLKKAKDYLERLINEVENEQNTKE